MTQDEINWNVWEEEEDWAKPWEDEEFVPLEQLAAEMETEPAWDDDAEAEAAYWEENRRRQEELEQELWEEARIRQEEEELWARQQAEAEKMRWRMETDSWI